MSNGKVMSKRPECVYEIWQLEHRWPVPQLCQWSSGDRWQRAAGGGTKNGKQGEETESLETFSLHLVSDILQKLSILGKY